MYCTLALDGKPFLDKSGFSLQLGQTTNDHDCFTIIVSDDALDSFHGYVMENSKNILGKDISINLHRFGEIKIFLQELSPIFATKKKTVTASFSLPDLHRAYFWKAEKIVRALKTKP
ncbi:hypothetical protein [Chryseobacterium indoltheticum]|uniref:hypothetical protein n=1 Tax=Chryseobacterium indoltheticum TaxID=254 RepID=UPI003F491C17